MAVLRAYTPADRDWLVEQHAAHYRDAEGFDESFGTLVGDILDAFAHAHDPSYEAGWIAEADGARLGSIFCVRLDETRAKLRLFLLTRKARGLGLGRRLLDHCMGFARESGYSGMTLWTHESHEAACALYLKTGWRVIRSEPVHSFGVDLIEQTFEIEF